MSMSVSGPSYGDDVYYYFEEKRVKGKKKLAKVRVRISDRNENGWYHLQRVRDGYTFITQSIEYLIKE